MENNHTLQRDVQDALEWEPLLKAAQIGVTADDGIVTLTGTVDSYAKKLEAEGAAKNVIGVKAVVEKIEVKFYSPLATRDDHEIALEVVNALERDEQIPADCVKVKVEDGWVTLEGSLPWNFQKETVRKAVANLLDIRGITDSITIEAETQDTVEEKVLQKAFCRNASLNEKEIKVDVSGATITLRGTVASAYQKSEAGRMAWNMAGVEHVDNAIVVKHEQGFKDQQ